MVGFSLYFSLDLRLFGHLSYQKMRAILRSRVLKDHTLELRKNEND
jgi:hypothetical protein